VDVLDTDAPTKVLQSFRCALEESHNRKISNKPFKP
jgi:hypothetical protein